MENQRIIELDETQVRELYPVPVIHTGYWTFIMEACLLTGELESAERSVFATFPEVIQHALTFTPNIGGWADRAQLWQTVLKLALPPQQYHAAMQKILDHYAKVVRKRRGSWRTSTPPPKGNITTPSLRRGLQPYRRCKRP